jgi:hypothetical protein
MFGQKFTNTNEILQCRILHYAKSAYPKSADLNTTYIIISLVTETETEHIDSRCRHGQRNGRLERAVGVCNTATGRARVPNDWLVLLLACMHARC